MKKVVTWLLCLAMAAGLGAVPARAEEKTELAVWVYPVGQWADETAAEELAAAFEQDRPDVLVTVTYLEEAQADSQIDEAILSGQTPDLLVGATAHLRETWGGQERMSLLAYVTQTGAEGERVNWCFACFDSGDEDRAGTAKAFADHVCAAVREEGAQVITEEMLSARRQEADRRIEERGGC